MRRSRIETIGIGLLSLGVIAAPLAGAVPSVSAAETVVVENDFEGSDYAPWGPRGSAQLAITADDAHTGAQSLAVTGRTADWNGPAADATALLAVGTEYAVFAWVKLAAGTVGSSDLHFTVEQTPAANQYQWVGGATPVTAGEWVQLSGTYTKPAGVTAASLYIEASPIDGAQPSFLVDDVLITTETATEEPGTPPADLGLDNDFETDLGAWGARGDGTATATITADEANSGARSAIVENRTQPWNGLAADVTDRFVAGSTYVIEAQVKLAAGATPDPSDLRLSIQRDNAGASVYDTITTIEGVTAGEWREVSVNFTMTSAESALLYFETVAGNASFLVDDISVTDAAASPIQTDIPSLQDELPWPTGVAIDERETAGSARDLVLKHYNQITAENYMKPEAIQPSEGEFTFAAADQLVDFAVANDLRVYGHTLVWHSQTPAWFFLGDDGQPLTDSTADQEILLARMQAHIQGVADHYREKYGEFGTDGNPIIAFDVVNEAIAESEDDGLRRSRWYDVLGETYLDSAFEFASEAFNGGAEDGPVTLFINDYSTEAPAKRQAMFDVVSRMLDRGAPVDGMGHQFHVNPLQPIAQLKASIDKFAELGLEQAVTEFDVALNGAVTPEKIVEQGYYYADAFDMLREYPDLFSVTLWGPYDSRSWLTPRAPLPFDDALQAKPAYYGIVDRTQLPPLTLDANVPAADIPLDDAAVESEQWDLLPLTSIETGEDGTTGFQARWAADRVTVYAEVRDGTDDGADDTITLFGGGEPLVVGRDGGETAVVEETEGGYTLVTEYPVPGAADGDALPFDIRVTDGSTGDSVSWNDKSNAQEDGERLGVLNLVGPVGFVEVSEAAGEPVIDGEIDEAWADAASVSTDLQVEGTAGATANARLLWSGSSIDLLVEVTDPSLDASSSNAFEQDSVEIFVDPVNAKAGGYLPEDGQYRINFNNAQSISGDLAVIGENLTSATSVVDGGYIVEASIELGADVEPGAYIGLDVQVNDATAGVRSSVRNWADPTGRSYQDTARWGVAQLVTGDEEPVEEQLVNLTAPTISGTTRVGRTLTADGGEWNVDSPTLAYQWKVDGEAIAGATSSEYRVRAADAGRALTVTVTASADGYTDGTADSAETQIAKVVSSLSGSADRVFSLGGRNVGYDARVTTSGIAPTGTVTVYDNGRAIAIADVGSNGRASVDLPRLSRGIHLLTSRYSGDDRVAGSSTPLSSISIVIVL